MALAMLQFASEDPQEKGSKRGKRPLIDSALCTYPGRNCVSTKNSIDILNSAGVRTDDGPAKCLVYHLPQIAATRDAYLKYVLDN